MVKTYIKSTILTVRIDITPLRYIIIYFSLFMQTPYTQRDIWASPICLGILEDTKRVILYRNLKIQM